LARESWSSFGVRSVADVGFGAELPRRESLGKRFTCDDVENDLYMYMYINLCLRRRKKHVLSVM
jgi:hypothetical protein